MHDYLTTLGYELPTENVILDSLLQSTYQHDPVRWVQDKVKENPWSKQREILHSVAKNRRTAVHACHASGKSWIASMIAAWWIETHPIGDAFVITTAPTASQVRTILWRELNRVHAKAKLTGRMNQTEWWAENEHGREEIIAIGRKPGNKPSDLSVAAFQGIHQQYVLVVVDEASGVDRQLCVAAETLISNENSRLLLIGNPDDSTSRFKEVCSPGSGFNVIGIDAFETPNFTNECVTDNVQQQLISPTWVSEVLDEWGDDSPLYLSKVRGQFAEDSESGLIPIRWVRAAQDRNLPKTSPIELGVDVGGGVALNVIACRWGQHTRVLFKSYNSNTMQTCGNVIQHLDNTGASIAKVDKTGIGWGTVDRLKELGKPATGIKVGDKAFNSEQFKNRRAEGFWDLRKRFEDGEIDIDPNDHVLAGQLCNIKYGVDSRGRIVVQSKQDMAKSPDEMDAVMLAFLGEDKRRKPKMTW